eukprot:gene2904-3958_t
MGVHRAFQNAMPYSPRYLQIRSPVEAEPLKGMEAKMDLVFVDAPCTGAGTWRRHPDSKWRLSPEQLERRIAEQDQVLDQACAYVKPGGRLIYVTCSIFAEENEDRIAAFLVRTPGFAVVPAAFAAVAGHATPEGFLRLTPLSASRRTSTVALKVALLMSIALCTLRMSCLACLHGPPETSQNWITSLSLNCLASMSRKNGA